MSDAVLPEADGAAGRHAAPTFTAEMALHAKGVRLVAGMDEAGRGPLAGPVVAAAVILPEGFELVGLDDSKKLTSHQRDEFFARITGSAAAWGVGMADHEEIDTTSILVAAMGAMRTAVEGLGVTPDVALVDGNRSPGLSCRERTIVEGDARCRCIAAASVLAKVTRDRLMIEMDDVFPGYGFARHKGYGAKAHVDAIRRLGPSPIHRMTFRIVPDVSPPGTAARILGDRLKNATTPVAFQSVVDTIARIKNHLLPGDVATLRDLYRSLADNFKA